MSDVEDIVGAVSPEDDSSSGSLSSPDNSTSSGNLNLSVMFCWGNTTNGELGLGGIEEQHILAPRELKFNHSNSIKTISCGKTHTLVVTRSGEVYSCGSNDYSQLGHDQVRTKLQLVPGLEASKVREVACGEYHSMALTVWGELFTWGCNNHGQLGHNTQSDIIARPKIVKALATHTIVQIACGYRHSLALTNRGELYAWGANDHGQLGIGRRSSVVPIPMVIASLHGLPLSYIACGANHTFVVSKSGAVYGWGKNMFGQLGLNQDADHIFPCQLKTLRSIRVKYIACGEDFSVFLTQDGGVLTCGAGQYGQLGHGSTANEILPRKVLELMGSTVTQVCCGRRHTLAYIPTRDRIYAFGLGGAGQLGTKQLVNSNSPQIVLGPWVETVKKFKIDRLYAGGDHCFVTVNPLYDESQALASYDMRVIPRESMILSVSLDKMQQCERVLENGQVDQDLLRYLETVLSSAYCINGSFLKSNEEHYCCTSKWPGIDVALAAKCFACITKVQNETIKNVIRDSICQLLSNLPESPPDVETLRLYISLPLYHEFENARHTTKLQGPFANAYLKLNAQASKIVGLWFFMQTDDYFEKLIRIYKNVVLSLLQAALPVDMNSFYLQQCGDHMMLALELLSRLSKLNTSETSAKVKYEHFYLSELTEAIDVRADYVKWATVKSGKKFFCDYAFLFDASAKMMLLQTDQTIQMHSAVQEATQRALTQLLFSPAPISVQPILELTVSRQNIIQDTIAQLSNYSDVDYKKPLRITFIGEEAEDAGGVKKEFFLLLLREILDPKYGMFKEEPETNSIWFSQDSFEDEIMYYLVGLVCGLAIYNFIIINLPFPIALYKKLLHEPVDLNDLADLSPSLARGLSQLLSYELDDVEEVFCLRFEVTRDSFGELKTIPLKPNGSQIPVTKENKKEYVDLYVDYVLNSSVERHFRAFHDAFHKVCGGRVLKLFHAQELMAVVIGNENYDWIMLENNCEYKNGYSSSNETVRLFWEVFHELPLEEKKKFLLFLTGTDRIPILGMKAIKMYIQPTHDDKFLPVAHTCFNLLDLPPYKTKERLRYKLLQAIQQTQGFSLV
ncbi:e3 ubiquitin-protein ligase [Nesidiocoris tenuis]|uniref:E3 ubiquitin-protein ligase n=1 Tax=Nesidiocoris tenuis TaxID=355587 RepID=A0ABN7AB97_9HEMI|nr:e3 ubiquitin-protein ligase [Nesidiocoris tenuis]